jgi:adenylate kinase
VILLMGMPGSGKGTQGKILADRHSFHLISMGELVRLYVTGQRRQQMLSGVLLDDQEIITILDSVLSSIKDDEECILDGFPRTIPQAQWLMEQIKTGRFSLNRVFHLVASREAVG